MKMPKDLFILVFLLSCQGPSAPPGKTDTTSSLSTAKQWIGDWKNVTPFAGAELKIDSIKDSGFSFSLEAFNGGNSGELSGVTRLEGNEAFYSKSTLGDTCRLQFFYRKDSIYIQQLQGDCGAGNGVYYGGSYYAKKAQPKDTSLVSLGVLNSETQDSAFRKLVGNDYSLFVRSSQIITDEQDLDSLGAIVRSAGVRGLFTIRENIVLINPRMEIWAAVIDGDSVNYYTNHPDYHHLPRTIDKWRENFNQKPVAYK